jgi:hypothetical protein
MVGMLRFQDVLSIVVAGRGLVPEICEGLVIDPLA